MLWSRSWVRSLEHVGPWLTCTTTVPHVHSWTVSVPAIPRSTTTPYTSSCTPIKAYRLIFWSFRGLESKTCFTKIQCRWCTPSSSFWRRGKCRFLGAAIGKFQCPTCWAWVTYIGRCMRSLYGCFSLLVYLQTGWCFSWRLVCWTTTLKQWGTLIP